ncbi:acetyltransferase, GNAT family protein [Histomonas meleagridis]|uniref:acetyltransferase, GNAT family protein n=1 Tax=Histomonas meleagridis TaxID=135588 RepID=UPI00355ABA97|nr:acetyltransferase, GNAT family protein [Histomonas meleagridis]KAH0806377.1 acetyltransferase, GNAT family protein [Histomonas meleagridis]
MPEYYITRLVFNENHKTVIILRNGRVYGGISFRPFKDRDFAEIAFCAVSTKQQIRGYGAHIMAHVKTYLQAIGIYNILTYADNTAVGYFKRQGFTLEMKLDTNKWVHYIKDYQGATLIHCQIRPDIDYLRIGDVVSQQKKLVSSLLPKTDITRVTHWPVKSIKGITIDKEPKVDVINQMHLIVSSIKLNSRSWPFLNPVSLKDAPNYLEIVQKPMDLSTIEKNIEENKYQTLDQFVDDMKLIFTNCYAYNAVDSVYHRSAKELEKYFEKLLMKTKEGRRR